LTLYRHTSGALVFGAGTVQWSWGLDGDHDRGGSTPDVAMQQATVNLFADMAVLPRTLQPGLVPGIPANDVTKPTSTITAPAAGAQVVIGTPVVIKGTASDAGGGQVSVVHVSTDGGATWQKASGTLSWTYTWTVSGSGSVTIKSRATDTSGNVETPSGGRTVTIAGTCPCSIWSAASTPGSIDTADNSAVELGVRFRATVGGTINGIRFYKGVGNTGTHTGSLWSNTGTLLRTATFSSETGSGWQQVTFSSPVAVTANTTYVASYHTNTGNYGVNDDYFATTGVDSGPLQALRDGVDGLNGVYRYGATSAFPNQSFQSANYWVDVVFVPGSGSDTTPPAIAITAPAAGATVSGANVTVSATASDNVGVVGVQFKLDGANLGAEDTVSPHSISWNSTLTVNGGHTLTAVARDAQGNTTTSAPVSVTVSNGPPPTSCPCTIWSATATPARIETADPSALEVGVRFRVDTTGSATGVRFYKGAGNTGTHLGSLWTDDGTLLASATFSNESPSGWQQATFTTPVALTANTVYVASYHMNGGNYAINDAYFAAAGVDSGPLHAPADGTAGANGVYRYAATTAFPNQTYQSANYWVDVVFASGGGGADTTPPTVSISAPAGGATVSGTVVSVTANAGDNVGVVGVQFKLDGANLGTEDSASPYSTTWNSTTAINGSHTLTAVARDAAGNSTTSAPIAVTVNNVPAGTCPCTIWSASATPGRIETSDSNAVEVGVRFRADVNGVITGIRFYKGAGNTGTHTGSLWTNAGVLLATATFSGEGASGWQQVLFSSPVAITANTTYVASYHTNTGQYAVSDSYFAAAGVDNAPLHALKNGADGANAVYWYGASAFPTDTYQSANYWVDVVFTPNGTP
jgi:hypothetical protein